jgi:hypothetical protein
MKTDSSYKFFEKATSMEIATALMQFGYVEVSYNTGRFPQAREVAKILEKKLGSFQSKQGSIPGGGSYSNQPFYYFHFENGMILKAIEQFDLCGWWRYSFIELDSEDLVRLFPQINELDNGASQA